MTSPLLQLALAYFAIGFNPFPLPLGSKVPIIKWKRLQTERATPWELAEWFDHRPVNIGLMTGRVSGGAVAFDCDEPSLARRIFGDLAELATHTYVSRTARGHHVIFRVVGGTVKTTTYRGRGVPLDVKAEGGYVVAPTSLHPDGVRYELLSHDPKPAAIARSEFDALILRLLSKQPALPGLGLEPERVKE